MIYYILSLYQGELLPSFITFRNFSHHKSCGGNVYDLKQECKLFCES